MSGLYVPLVMIPRFTSYLGEGVYLTEPLDVSAYSRSVLTVWRGPLVGDTGDVPPASLEFVFEQADDPDVWSEFPVAPITDPDDQTVVELSLVMRWMRVKLTLVADEDDVVALTCWVMGSLEKREQS